ncbi:MAG: RluA family pseudouridine synthase [Victivallaceae bacterium]|nr:RluA family pseudouridine synthase [Victivallaceae bacterium]
MNLENRIIKSRLGNSAEGSRLDHYLAERFTYHSLEKWRELISDGQILLNDKQCFGSTILSRNDVLIYMPRDLEEPPVDFNYSIVYEDEHLFVINKSGNLPCHPSGPFFKHTLWHHVSTRYGKIYLINRLDRETSGLLIAARNPETAGKFSKQLAPMEKEYRALVFGDFNKAVDAEGYLIKDTASVVRKKRHFVFADKLPEDAEKVSAVKTLFEAVWSKNGFSLVKAILKTGRLHQIRASLFSLGFPLVGDKLYGSDDRIYLKIRDDKITDEDWKNLVMRRQALHSYRLSFIHPENLEKMEFTAPLPGDFACS